MSEKHNEVLDKGFQSWFDIFAHAKWGIAVIKVEDGTFDSYNQSFAELYDYDATELIGKHESLIFEDRYIEEHDIYQSKHKQKNGLKFYAQIEVMVLKNILNEPLYRVYNVWDISDKHYLNERLRINQFAIDHTKEAIYLADQDANFIYVNQAASQSLGYDREELLSMNLIDIDPHFTKERLHKLHKRLKKNRDLLIEVTHKRKDGTVFPVEVSGSLFEYKGMKYYLSVERDITERKAMQEALILREKEFHSLADNIPDNIVRWDSEGRYLFVNKTLLERMPLSYDELMGKKIKELFPKTNVASQIDKAVNEVINTRETVNLIKFEYPTKDGGTELHDLILVPEFDAKGAFKSVLAVGRDMSEYYRMQDEILAQEQRLRYTIEAVPGVVSSYYLKPDGSVSIPYIAPNCKELFGVEAQAVMEDPENLFSLVYPGNKEGMRESIAESARYMSVWHYEYRINHPEKGERWIEGNTNPVEHPDGGIIWHGYFHDITERKRTEKKGEFLAYYDTLTGLPNRTLAQDRAEQLFLRAQRDHNRVACLFIDIDNFNVINNALGHHVSDRILESIATRLCEVSRKTDVVSRFEGNKFLLAMADMYEMHDIVNAIEKVTEAFDAPCDYAEHSFLISLSVGVSLYPDNGTAFEMLLQKAETALYRAKEDGDNIYRFFNEL